MKNISRLFVLGMVLLATSCSGVRSTDQTFSSHGETIRLIGWAIAGDDQQAALDHVPAGATITNVSSTPADWSSIIGVLNSIIGFNSTSIGGTIE
ncbi:MAG: tRNA modification GTPase [Planctomycetota bacterium]